jgi:hypothetical protein
MGAPQPGLRRNAVGSLGILAVVAGIAIGLPALDRALPGARATASGTAYPVSDAVTIVPPSGARLDLSQTRPGHDSGYVVFLVGRVRVAVVTSHERLSLDDAATRLRTRLRDSLGASPTADRYPLAGVAADLALAGRFRAGPDDGWYAVRILGLTTVVDATASGPPDELTERLPAIEASVASIASHA